MAEGFLKSLISNDENMSTCFSTSSCGINAYSGDPVSDLSVDAMKNEWQIDISAHHSTCLNEYILDNSYLVLTMEKRQKEYLISLFPEYYDKIFCSERIRVFINLQICRSKTTLKIQIFQTLSVNLQIFTDNVQEI